MPDAFKMFTGPLSVAEKPCRRRSIYSEFFYMEQDRLGWCSADHSWSTVNGVLYFTDVVNPMASYFHTVICNSPEFRNTTTVNGDLSHILWDSTPPASGPVHLRQSRNCGTRKSSQGDEKRRTSSEESRMRQDTEDDCWS
ncbi:hypothetical protein C4D60_Mb01t11170 [Musa balbisiana]|uniref:Uncharacterized protein n=1 Tax=Musa balbisiana TaxID=52838 RepID=A0A4S8JLE1_MUSBA|nr:hypothetical protein C4D60_Mb01t11170 [Musa balbisiana]